MELKLLAQKASTITIAVVIASGCTLEASEPFEPDSGEKSLATLYRAPVVYSFQSGNWQARTFDFTPPFALVQTDSFSFGVANDIPLIGPDSSGAGTVVGTYGTTTAGDRRGRFFFDEDRSRSWGPGDTESKFMASPQAGDRPFVTRGQLWGRNGSGVCAPRTTGGSSNYALTGRMIGIKRGTTIYWDRDGNGTWGGANHCDLSGNFGNATDAPIGVSDLVGTTRISGTIRHWFVDTNKNLFWDTLDSMSTNFGATTDFIPASHPYALNVQRGTNVYVDWNGNYVWDTASDRNFFNAIPSSSWQLVGVAH